MALTSAIIENQHIGPITSALTWQQHLPLLENKWKIIENYYNKNYLGHTFSNTYQPIGKKNIFPYT